MMNATYNAKWISLAQGVRIFSQVANILFLARFLDPSSYGLMAMATVVTNLALLLRDLGTAAAVIQKENLTDETTTTVFWLNVAMGTLIAIALLIFSPLIASAFNAPALVPVLCALAIIFPITSSTTAHQALLERKSAFRTIARIEAISSLLGLGVAIVAAWFGAGVYSLVLQAITTAVLSSLQLWIASDWRPKGRWNIAELKGIMGFSGNMAGYQLISYLFRNADGMVIGRYLGSGALGIYSMAYKLMLFPVQNITWVAARALYPVMSRQQNAVNQMGDLYLRSVRFISFITAPLMIGMFVLREPFVLVAFGKNWSQVADVLFWLAPVGYLQSIVGTTGPVFMAQGRTDLLMRLAIFGAVLHVSAFVIGSNWGLNGVASCYLIASVINTLPTLYFALKLIRRSVSDFLDGIWLPFAFALLMGAALHYMAIVIDVSAGYVILKLMTLGVIGVLIYLGLGFVFSHRQTRAVIMYPCDAKS